MTIDSDKLSDARERLASLETAVHSFNMVATSNHVAIMIKLDKLAVRQEQTDKRVWKLVIILSTLGAGSGTMVGGLLQSFF